MKLWLITPNQPLGHDTYDSAVVAAKTMEDAQKVHPSSLHESNESAWEWSKKYGDWVHQPDQVTAELIGTTNKYTAGQVVIASFNAG